MSTSQWLNIIGLLLDLVGAGFLVGGLFFTKKRMTQEVDFLFDWSSPWWWPLRKAPWWWPTPKRDGLDPAKSSDFLTLDERVRQHKNAFKAFPLLIGGYILQIIGNCL